MYDCVRTVFGPHFNFKIQRMSHLHLDSNSHFKTHGQPCYQLFRPDRNLFAVSASSVSNNSLRQHMVEEYALKVQAVSWMHG